MTANDPGDTKPKEPSSPAMPTDPITLLMAGAAQLHEFYVSLVNSGFEPDQAIELTKTMMIAAVRGGAS
jgi:hypothetical protein